MKRKIVLVFGLVLIAGTLLVNLSACSSTTTANETQSQQQGISVGGEGIVKVTPDIATLDLGVAAEASTVADAQSQVSTAMNQVTSALTSNGVAQKDIQTQNYTIQQITAPVPPPVTVTPYNSSSGTSSSGGSITSTAPPIITTITPTITTTPSLVIEYQVSNTIVVTIRTINNTGSLIDAVVSAGGNLISIEGVTLSVDQPDQYYTQARQLAMTDAANKASQLAKAAGVTLGSAISISENDSPPIYPQVFGTANVAASSATSINPGETSITIDVQIVYAIK